jgi:hypothetical protein
MKKKMKKKRWSKEWLDEGRHSMIVRGYWHDHGNPKIQNIEHHRRVRPHCKWCKIEERIRV